MKDNVAAGLCVCVIMPGSSAATVTIAVEAIAGERIRGPIVRTDGRPFDPETERLLSVGDRADMDLGALEHYVTVTPTP